MGYFPELDRLFALHRDWLALRKEQGLPVGPARKRLEALLNKEIAALARMRPPRALAAREPDGLRAIRALRPAGPRRLPLRLTDEQLLDRLEGAWFGRAAGCMLGLPCEGYSKQAIRNACASLKNPWPLRDYWVADPQPPVGPESLHYKVTKRGEFIKGRVGHIGADDDLAYTLLGLLILEQYGADFTPRNVAAAWLKYLPEACTAEKVALANFKKGIFPPRSAAADNPYSDWIGADIRSDPWGYAAPGELQLAAEFAWRDASVSHRAAGVHGEMYFSAVIAAAFAVDDPIEAVKLGLTEIPRRCRVAGAVRAALRACASAKSWEPAVDAIFRKYKGMSAVHTLNNLELTIAGLWFGGGDFGKTISLTVMAGADTDCTGATAGSILGAVLGRKRLPRKWVRPLGGRVESYLIGKRWWRSGDVARRFLKVSQRMKSA